jgi:hypothetical protein
VNSQISHSINFSNNILEISSPLRKEIRRKNSIIFTRINSSSIKKRSVYKLLLAKGRDAYGLLQAFRAIESFNPCLYDFYRIQELFACHIE